MGTGTAGLFHPVVNFFLMIWRPGATWASGLTDILFLQSAPTLRAGGDLGGGGGALAAMALRGFKAIVCDGVCCSNLAWLVLARWRDNKLAVGQTTVLACWHNNKLAAGRTAVFARWRNNESAVRRMVVLACWRDDKSAAGRMADNGALALSAVPCLLVRRRVGGRAEGGAHSLARQQVGGGAVDSDRLLVRRGAGSGADVGALASSAIPRLLVQQQLGGGVDARLLVQRESEAGRMTVPWH